MERGRGIERVLNAKKERERDRERKIERVREAR